MVAVLQLTLLLHPSIDGPVTRLFSALRPLVLWYPIDGHLLFWRTKGRRMSVLPRL